MADSDVLMVTGLSDAAPAVPEAPAAPPAQPEATPIETGEAQPAEQPAAAEEVQQATAEAPAAPADGQPAETPKKPARGVQKALDRLAGEREAQRQRAEAAEAVARALAAQLQAGAQAQPQPAQPAQEAPPERSAYADWESFNRATAQYEARQTATQVLRQGLGNFISNLAQQQQIQNVAQQEQSVAQKLAEAYDKGPERFPDWDERVAISQAPVTPAMKQAIAYSADPAAIAHYLALNPQVHDELLRLPPARQVQRIGEISGSLVRPPATSQAPAPARPIAGKAGSGPVQADNMSAAEWKAYVAKNGLTRGLR